MECHLQYHNELQTTVGAEVSRNCQVMYEMGGHLGSEELHSTELPQQNYNRRLDSNLQSHSRREEEVPSRSMATISCSVTEEEEGAEVMRDLPEDIVLNIIAMAPFPSIFQATGLSKAWRARLSPSISWRLTDGEKERGFAASFQKQVIKDWSKNWETFSPVFFSEHHLVTYGHKSRNWRRFSLSFLPKIFIQNFHTRGLQYVNSIQIEGALLCRFLGSFGVQEMYVADILTQRWKQLPPPPGKGAVFTKVVSDRSLGTYKVILFCRGCYDRPCLHGNNHFSTHIYESNSETWSTLKFNITARDFFQEPATFSSVCSDAAFLNGVLYMVTRMNLQHLLAFNLAERTLEELELKCNDREITRITAEISRIHAVSLLVCNDNRLIMVIMSYSTMVVLEVDLHSLQLIRLCSSPPARFKRLEIDDVRPVSDGNCVFFKMLGRRGETVLAYNVNEDAWSSWPIPAALSPNCKTYHWLGSSFQPSLSAFLSL